MKNQYSFLKRAMLIGSLILFLGSVMAPQLNAQPYEKDSPEGLALQQIFADTDGANWTDKTNWGSNLPLNQWYGVTASGTTVTKLILKTNNLDGFLPDVFDDLADLVNLNLRDNPDLGGSLPATIGDLVNLTFLSLKACDFSGHLPAGFSNLNKLTEVWIHENGFTGNIPEISTFSKLKYFSVGKNKFFGFAGTGPVHLSLKELLLADNMMTFEDLVPLKGVASNRFTYAPQGIFDVATALAKTAGESLTLTSLAAYTGNAYQWYKDAAALLGKTANPFMIGSLVVGDAGTYFVKVTNSELPLLTLTSATWLVSVGPAGPAGFPEWYITSDAAGSIEVVIQEPPAPPGIWRGHIYTEVFNSPVWEYVRVSSVIDFTASSAPYHWNPDSPISVLDQARKIKIQLQDGWYGILSPISEMQQSQHVTINAGLGGSVNLIWTPYLGRTVTGYVVLGAHNLADFYTPVYFPAAGANVWPLATLPSDARSFTDLAGAYPFYLVAAVLSSPSPLKGGEDIMAMSNPVSQDMITMEYEAKMNIYPNPVKNMATIEFDNLSDSEFTMYLLDLSGKVLRQQENITGTQFTFDRGDLRKGIYIVQMVGDRTINRKMVID